MPDRSAPEALITALTEALVLVLGAKRGERLVVFMADRLAQPGPEKAARAARAIFRRRMLTSLISLLRRPP